MSSCRCRLRQDPPAPYDCGAKYRHDEQPDIPQAPKTGLRAERKKRLEHKQGHAKQTQQGFRRYLRRKENRDLQNDLWFVRVNHFCSMGVLAANAKNGSPTVAASVISIHRTGLSTAVGVRSGKI